MRLFKGDEAADKIAVLLGVQPNWLEAAFAEIDARWGSFDNYVSQGLGLSTEQVEALRNSLLE